MDLIDQVQAISAKIRKQKDIILTEEATKTAFVLPFIQALGYDVFDPSEVVPEFTADFGTKKGEKVDYAICLNGKVTMLIECKTCGAPLEESQHSQLFRYFTTTESRIGVLTDGIIYRFFSDIEEKNKMDSKPFMEFNMLDVQDNLVVELKRFSKQLFNLDEIISIAGDLKYTREIKRLCVEQFKAPCDEFTTFFARQVYAGKLTQAVREQFKVITKRALGDFLNDSINDRLRSAIAQSTPNVTPPPDAPSEQVPENPQALSRSPERRLEELEAFYIVKAILSLAVDPNRIAHRDSQNHFNILLDNSIRKPICRLGLEKAPKYIGFLNEQKQEERIQIQSINDIFQYAERLKAALVSYEKRPVSV
jgi:hypothetical protein